jgi:electron transport complex protein RnfG
MAATPEPAARRSVRAAFVLLCAAVLAFGVVSLVHEATRDAVAAAERGRQLARFEEVLRGQRYDNDPLADTIAVRDAELLGSNETMTVHRARLGLEPVAVILAPVARDGYSGPIELLVAIAPDGTLLGVRVSAHRETPGLGDGIESRKSDWIGGFAGRSLDSPPPARWKVRKDGGDFDQFTGATVTPRAIVAAVANTLVYFERHRDELLAPAATMPP